MKNKKASTKNAKSTEEIVEEVRLQGKDNRVYLDKNGIIHWEVISQEDLDPLKIERDIQEVLKAIFKLAKKSSSGKAKVFMDFHRVVSAGTAKSRRMLSDALKTGIFEKIAALGMSALVQTAAKFVITYAGIKSVKFFKSKEQALEWLKE